MFECVQALTKSLARASPAPATKPTGATKKKPAARAAKFQRIAKATARAAKDSDSEGEDSEDSEDSPEDSSEETVTTESAAARVAKLLAKPKAKAAEADAATARAVEPLKSEAAGDDAPKPAKVRKVVQGDLGKPKVPPTPRSDQSALEAASAAQSGSPAAVDRSAAKGTAASGQTANVPTGARAAALLRPAVRKPAAGVAAAAAAAAAESDDENDDDNAPLATVWPAAGLAAAGGAGAAAAGSEDDDDDATEVFLAFWRLWAPEHCFWGREDDSLRDSAVRKIFSWALDNIFGCPSRPCSGVLARRA
jgi:hypothetical protein